MFICQYWTPRFQSCSYLINLICYILTFVLLVTNKTFTYKRLKIITAEIIALTSEAMYLHYLYTSQHIKKLAWQTHLFLVKKCNTMQKKNKILQIYKTEFILPPDARLHAKLRIWQHVLSLKVNVHSCRKQRIHIPLYFAGFSGSFK